MTQQQFNSLVALWIFTIIGFWFVVSGLNLMYSYYWEVTNRLTQLEERVNFQVERVSRTDNNLYHKIMTDETSELVKKSHKFVEDVLQLDTMFYSFENEWVVFEYTLSITGEQEYIYVDIDRKVIVKDYKPKF